MKTVAKKVDMRHMKIRELLMKQGYLSTPDLCARLGCSEATMRNDLAALEKQGLLKRTYGGAMSTGNTPFLAGLDMRKDAFTTEKRSIAKYVVENMISEGLTVILDTGTTSLELARQIAALPYSLTVLTNSLPVAFLISQNEAISLHLAGGRYDHGVGSFHDQDTIAFLEMVSADFFFLCPSSISASSGIAVPDPSEAAVKILMMKKTARTVALADHSKLDRRGFRMICPPSETDCIVTDEGASPKELQKLREAGAKILVAPYHSA